MVIAKTREGKKPYCNARFTDHVADVHLSHAVVCAAHSPQLASMIRPGLADSRNDALASGQQLADELESNTSGGTDDDPGSHLPIGVQDIRDTVHAGA